MSHIILQKSLEEAEKSFMDEVFPGNGACFARAFVPLFHSVLCAGSALVSRMAETVRFGRENDGGGRAERKRLRERVSEWLERHDYASGADRWLLSRFAPGVGRDTVIAADISDISKEFGGKGMEGMEKGYDASRKTLAHGHNFCAACAANTENDIVAPLHFTLRKGRKNQRALLHDTLAAVSAATRGNGVFVMDRASDGEEAMAALAALGHRAVVRVNNLGRDVFGTGKNIDAELAALPPHAVALRKNSVNIKANIRWRQGFYGEGHIPVLVVESQIADRTIYIYLLPGKGDGRKLPDSDKTPQEQALLRACAVQAAQAYLLRWHIETFFLRVKQDFKLEQVRVRTFRRLTNIFYLCVLAYAFVNHTLPGTPAPRDRILKILKDNFRQVSLRMQVFLAGLRALMEQTKVNFISGRPKKTPNPSDNQQLLLAY